MSWKPKSCSVASSPSASEHRDDRIEGMSLLMWVMYDKRQCVMKAPFVAVSRNCCRQNVVRESVSCFASRTPCFSDSESSSCSTFCLSFSTLRRHSNFREEMR